MEKLTEIIKGGDMFGHTINLNFNKEGETHNTLLGGFFSFLIRITMSIYVIVNFKKMILFEDNANATEVSALNLDEQGIIDYKDTSFLLYQSLIKKSDGSSVDLNEETFRYIDIHYEQIERDWYKYPDPDYEIATRREAKICDQSDFGDGPKAEFNFKAWTGFKLICPAYYDF